MINKANAEAVNPKNGDKYSPNLFRWLNKQEGKSLRTKSSVYRDSDGELYIGLRDEDWLHGSRLVQALCLGGKAPVFAFHLDGAEEVADFWPRYIRDGRCAIDESHTMGFVGDQFRWETSGDVRSCKWCGNHTQKLIKRMVTTERSDWVSASFNRDELPDCAAPATARAVSSIYAANPEDI